MKITYFWPIFGQFPWNNVNNYHLFYIRSGTHDLIKNLSTTCFEIQLKKRLPKEPETTQFSRQEQKGTTELKSGYFPIVDQGLFIS